MLLLTRQMQKSCYLEGLHVTQGPAVPITPEELGSQLPPEKGVGGKQLLCITADS